MHKLPRTIPDVRMPLALAPEELAATILFLLKKRNDTKFHAGNLQNALWGHFTSGQPQYPQQYANEINQALAEAWAWLQAQGLLVADMENGQHGGELGALRWLDCDFENLSGADEQKKHWRIPCAVTDNVSVLQARENLEGFFFSRHSGRARKLRRRNRAGPAEILAEVRHGNAKFCDFWGQERDKSSVCNRGFRKSDVVQTYPLEANAGG